MTASLFLGFLRPVHNQSQTWRILHRRLHHKEVIAVGGDFEQTGSHGLGRKQNLRLAQLHAVAVSGDFHRCNARVVIQVENFFAVAAPYRSETVSDKKFASGFGERDDVDLAMSGLKRFIRQLFCIWRKHRETGVELLIEKGVGLAVAKHGHHPYVVVTVG